MKANELRKDNLLLYDGKIVFIAEILKDNLVTIYNGSGLEKGTTLGCLRPIPLTEEILLKIGANRIEENHVSLMLDDAATNLILMKAGTHWFPSIEQAPEFSMLDSNIVSLNFIDAIHQLQNLFFALTSRELNIKL